MDLVGAESRRGGTRGGRSTFTWDSVKKNDREYYLGQSVAGVKTRWAVPVPGEQQARGAGGDDEIRSVRQRERAVLDAALGGHSFAEAVRSALMETCEGGDVDEGSAPGAGSGQDVRMDAPRALTKEERSEKAQRKLQRKRRREERRVRRAERQRRRAARYHGAAPHADSSESERESIRSRTRDDPARSRRRRKERESGTKRKRECMSSSDMDESDPVNARRTRMR